MPQVRLVLRHALAGLIALVIALAWTKAGRAENLQPRRGVVQASPNGSGAAGGTILRLVSGIEGNEPANPPLEAIPSPPPEADEYVPPSAIMEPVVETESHGWIDPYRMGEPGVRRERHRRFEWIPQGMLPFCDDRTPTSDRFTGRGGPLVGASWLNRPFHAGWFAGSIDTGMLINDRIGTNVGFYGGYRMGWDYDYYWGLETRLGASNFGMENLEVGNDVNLHSANLWGWDLDMLYYPWGDSTWRPFFLLGLGFTQVQFYDQNGVSYDEGLFSMPIGFGLKVRTRPWLAWRLEFVDNIAFGHNNLATEHNVSCLFGCEIHFGGPRTSYFPWNPDAHLW